MKDLAWNLREVTRQFVRLHRVYYSNENIIIRQTDQDKHFRPVAKLCLEQELQPKHFVEAQFYFLTKFYKEKNIRRFPITAINIKVNAIDRYNRFLEENKKKTGSRGVSEKDVIEYEVDLQAEALLHYVITYIRFGSELIAYKTARSIDPTFEVHENKDVATQALSKLCPAVIPYIHFEEGWSWKELRKFLADLRLIKGEK